MGVEVGDGGRGLMREAGGRVCGGSGGGSTERKGQGGRMQGERRDDMLFKGSMFTWADGTQNVELTSLSCVKKASASCRRSCEGKTIVPATLIT